MLAAEAKGRTKDVRPTTKAWVEVEHYATEANQKDVETEEGCWCCYLQRYRIKTATTVSGQGKGGARAMRSTKIRVTGYIWWQVKLPQ